MTKKRRPSLAVSEVLDVVLLLGITMVLFAILFVVVFSFTSSPNPPSVHLLGTVEEDTITIANLGGSSLSLDTEVILTIDDSTIQVNAGQYLVNTNNNDYWDVGEEFVKSDTILSYLNSKAMVGATVVDKASNSIIMTGLLQQGTSGGVPSGAMDILDYVDNNRSNVDGAFNKGIHGNFENEKNKDGSYDMLAEKNIDIKDFVDSDTSDLDTSPDKGTHSNFENEKSVDGGYDILTEKNTSIDIKDTLDSNTCNQDGIGDKGSEINFLNAQGITLDGNFMTIQEANQGGIINEHYNYVDSQSNSHPPTDIGTHSNFAEMQNHNYIYDTLTEENTAGTSTTTLINQESFEGTWFPPAWSGTGNWNKENNQVYRGSYSADFDGLSSGSSSGNLVTPAMDCSGVKSIYVDFYTRDNGSDSGEYYLDFYDGSSWDQITRLDNVGESSWYHYTNTITDSQYFKSDFQIRWRVVDLDNNEHVYVDLVTVSKVTNNYNYNLDLEVRWTSAYHDETNEYLCIYGGTQNPEALQVDVWTGTAWTLIIAALSSGWNNVSVSPYLTSSYFYIRFVDTTQSSDTSQSNWQVEGVLLHTWSQTNNYQIDLEYQWTAADYTQVNKQLCFYVSSHTGTENLLVNYWTGSAWSSLGTITGTGTRILPATGLTSSTYTIQLKGATESGDSTQDRWNIDCIFLHCYSLNYSSDLEVQWTSVDFNEMNEFLCIRTGSLDSSENLKVEVRTGSTWTPLISALLPNTWNNVSVSSYLTSGTFTIRYLGSVESGDTKQSSWSIDATLLHLVSPEYKLDLEVQWTSVKYLLAHKELCIYTGPLGSENIIVDAWNGNNWIPIFNPLQPSRWNNASISVTGSRFIIRYRDGNPINDLTQDVWNLDAALIHLSS